MDDDPTQVVGRQICGVALDAHVPESVRRTARLEDLARDAGRGHLVDLTGGQRLRQERHRRP
jgi:hypothetical protein